jgi:hypothetical protein
MVYFREYPITPVMADTLSPTSVQNNEGLLYIHTLDLLLR